MLLSSLRPRLALLAVPLIALCLAILLYRLAVTFEFGGDEGYELIKAFLCSQGFRLYTDIWNDQPQFHTMLLSLLFRLFGPFSLVGRLLTVAFSVLLLLSCYEIIKLRSGKPPAIVAVLLLLSCPAYAEASVSAMLGLPALSLGLLSVWLIFRYQHSNREWLLMLSGFCMGLALQTKLTSLLVMPSVLIEFLARNRRSQPGHSFLFALVRYGAFVIAGLLVVKCFYPEENTSALLRPHFSPLTRESFAYDSPLRSLLHSFYGYADWTLAAIFGGVYVLRRGGLDLLFPIGLLTTLLLAHSIHKPYWSYYWVHFLVPLAWLAANGLLQVYALLRQGHSARQPWSLFWTLGSLLLASTFAALTLERTIEVGEKILSRNASADWAIVARMRDYAPVSRWVYTDKPIYAFHARLRILPPLAVITLKRIASDRLTGLDIVNELERYRPEQIVLRGLLPMDEDLRQYLDAKYTALESNGWATLFLEVILNLVEN
jgi:4-amino-4-deoxy-L-arabinose transferase-like glycosyltransferase